MKKNVTIKDIARVVGVHHTTVSLALRNSDALKKETKAKIQAIAREMGYHTNLLAQGFRNRRSNTIGLLVPEIQHHFFSKFISEVSEKANQKGLTVMVFQSNENLETEKKNIHYAGLVMIYMQALRYMADYLNGDIYYKITYPEQNFDRAKNQLTLLQRLEEFLKGKSAFTI